LRLAACCRTSTQCFSRRRKPKASKLVFCLTRFVSRVQRPSPRRMPSLPCVPKLIARTVEACSCPATDTSYGEIHCIQNMLSVQTSIIETLSSAMVCIRFQFNIYRRYARPLRWRSTAWFQEGRWRLYVRSSAMLAGLPRRFGQDTHLSALFRALGGAAARAFARLESIRGEVKKQWRYAMSLAASMFSGLTQKRRLR